MSEKVFLNGELVAAEQGRLSAFDAGFLHGAGLFETMRAYHGRVYRLGAHLDRLIESAKQLLIPVAGDKEFLAQAVRQTIEANGLSEARVRLTVSRGSLRDDPNKTESGTILATASALVAYPDEYYRKGMMVVLADSKLNSTDPVARHKSTNYLSRLLALRKARDLGAGEALWFTEVNRLGEGCISNVFLVTDGKLLTPGLDEPILPGITRATVLALAKTEKIPAVEQALTIDDVLAADEIFLTNSIMEVMPVSRVEKHKVGHAEPGALTRRLAELYRRDVAERSKADS
jgi:branched-chain amino acid aminotransferase